MGLIDPGIMFRQDPGAMAQGAQQGMGLMQGMRQAREQRQDRSRSDQAREAFAKSAQGEDITSPDGMKRVIVKFAQAGFPQEAAAVLEAHKEMFPQAKPVPAKWGAIPGTGTLFDESTGTTKASGADPLKPTPAREWDPLGKDKLEEDKRHNRAMEANGARQAGEQKPGQIFTQEQQLRTQYLGQTKDFRDVRDAYGRISSSAKDSSPAGDLSLIYNFMKMQDPGSTVRESEFAAAAASGSYGDRLQAAGEKILSGKRLSPEQRADFAGQAKRLYGAAEFQKKKTQSEYRKMAGQYPGLNPDRVLFEDNLTTAPAPATPAQADPAKVAKAKQYMALPPDSPFRTPAHDAAAKAILGL